MEKLKTAQDLIKTSNSSVSAGFNMFIYGYDYPLHNEYHDHVARQQGFDYAKEMAENGEISFTHKFKCECGDIPFQYGGFWVCNSCGTKHAEKDWWEIKVEKDGNEFCCHGLDFEDLQSSNNYAFGKTFSEAINNYEDVMRALTKENIY